MTRSVLTKSDSAPWTACAPTLACVTCHIKAGCIEVRELLQHALQILPWSVWLQYHPPLFVNDTRDVQRYSHSAIRLFEYVVECVVSG